MDENKYRDINRTLNVVNRLISMGVRILGGLTFLGCLGVWVVTKDHLFEPYVAGASLSMMGGSVMADAWMDLRAAKSERKAGAE